MFIVATGSPELSHQFSLSRHQTQHFLSLGGGDSCVFVHAFARIRQDILECQSSAQAN